MKEVKKFYTMNIPKFESKREEWLNELSKTKDDGSVIELEIEFIPNEPNELKLQKQSLVIKQPINFKGKLFNSRVEVVEEKFNKILGTARAKYLELENDTNKDNGSPMQK